jgi:hypothetical protein
MSEQKETKSQARRRRARKESRKPLSVGKTAVLLDARLWGSYKFPEDMIYEILAFSGHGDWRAGKFVYWSKIKRDDPRIEFLTTHIRTKISEIYYAN